MFSSFYSLFRPPPTSTLFPYTTLFRSIRTDHLTELVQLLERSVPAVRRHVPDQTVDACGSQPLDLIRARLRVVGHREDRKSTRLNSSHRCISYAVFCLKKKKKERQTTC